MSTRKNLNDVLPDAIKAVMGLENYMHKTTLSKTEYELIKIRASQINGCAFCIDMHTKDARKYGETEQRIYLLNAWRETKLFTASERAILALTEQVTNIQQSVTDEVYNTALEVLGETKTAEVIMATVTINAWNRIAISTQRTPGEQI